MRHNSPTDLQTQPQILNTSPLSRLPSSPPPPPSSLLPSSLSSVSLSLPPPPQPPATSSNVHLVFSTDCSGYQHWQGIALWFAAKEAGQKGPITRIASGCGEQQQRDVADEWRRIDRSGQLRVHFTPHMELKTGPHGGRKYPYSNKPGGLKHWLEHASPPIKEDFVCLVDPDMLLLRPITPLLAEGLVASSREGKSQSSKKQYELSENGTGIGRVLAAHSLQTLPARVTLGRPAGQHFGIGGVWARAGTKMASPAFKDFSKADVCGFDGAPCTQTTLKEADTKYAVGPVYLAHVQDWRRVSRAWWQMMPKVHDQYPQLLAEMYAMTIATANLTLPWSLVSHFMVSDPKTMSPTEAWSWVEDLTLGADGFSTVCEGANATTRPIATRERPMSTQERPKSSQQRIC